MRWQATNQLYTKIRRDHECGKLRFPGQDSHQGFMNSSRRRGKYYHRLSRWPCFGPADAKWSRTRNCLVITHTAAKVRSSVALRLMPVKPAIPRSTKNMNGPHLLSALQLRFGHSLLVLQPPLDEMPQLGLGHKGRLVACMYLRANDTLVRRCHSAKPTVIPLPPDHHYTETTSDLTLAKKKPMSHACWDKTPCRCRLTVCLDASLLDRTRRSLSQRTRNRSPWEGR